MKMILKNLNDKLNNERLVRLAFPLGLLTLVLMALLFIEYKHPYFFLQDDNRDYMLPYFVHNYESLLNGEIALYNFHQFLGTPVLAVGQTAALYPLTYLSVFLSNLTFGHYFAAVEIQVIIHLLIGTVGFYRFIRFFDLDHRAAFFGGLTWSLSSFIIYASNSWIVVSAPAAYFPWMLLFSFRLYKNPSTRVTIFAVLVRLLFFYVGYIQYFIFSVIFEFITVIAYVISDSDPGEKKVNVIKFFKKYIEGYIYVCIFSLPLLLPMWHQTTISAERSGRLPFEMFVSLRFPIVELLRGLFIPGYGKFGFLSYIGVVTLCFLVIGLYNKFVTRKYKNIISPVKMCVFLIPLAIAFFWSTNRMFNCIIYLIPILNRFRWPFKIAFYLNFYIIVIASIILNYILSVYKKKIAYKNILFWLIIVIQVLNFTILYSKYPYSFGAHIDKVPLAENLKDELAEGRIISLGFEIWSPAGGNSASNLRTAPTLGFNYATLWGLDYFAGYEPLLSVANTEACLGMNFKAIISSSEPIPVDYLRKAAVKWYIVPESKADEYTEKLGEYGIVKKYEDENRVVFYDAQAYPMVFNSLGEQIESADYRVTTNSIELSIDCRQADIIIFNNLYNPFFEGFIDGEKASLTPINKIHTAISVPEGKHHILIRYHDPYLIAGTCFATAFLIVVIFVRTLRILFKRQ